MRGTDLLDGMELADPAYVQAADTLPRRKKRYARWGALAACLCLVAAGALMWSLSGTDANGSAGDCFAADSVANSGSASADDGLISGEGGVTIPPMEVTLSAPEGVEMDMIGFFIYQGRCYVQYDWIQNGMDLVGEHLGTAIGLIDEWTPEDGYVELAGSIDGDFYAVNGFDPAFLLCMMSGEDEVELYVCGTGITLKYGAELYEDRLHLSGNYTGVEYESRKSWYYSEGKVRQVSDAAAVSDFVAALNEAEFLLWSDAVETLGESRSSVYGRELYHLYFRMNSGMTVHLRLYEGGYVRAQGIMDVCVQIPEEEYSSFLRILND